MPLLARVVLRVANRRKAVGTHVRTRRTITSRAPPLTAARAVSVAMVLAALAASILARSPDADRGALQPAQATAQAVGLGSSARAAPTRACKWGRLGPRNLPGACWRPYGRRSPFNRELPAAPKLSSSSSAIVERWADMSLAPGSSSAPGFQVGTADTRDDFGHPIYFSRPRHPRFKVHCTERWGRCEVEGARVRIPNTARPAGGGDGHLAVIDQRRGWEYDFLEVQRKPRGGGRLRVSWGGRTRIGTRRAHGLGSSATAAHFGLAAGMIRPVELRSGHIDHALFMAVRCTNGTYVWPAHGPGAGTSCASIGLPNSNAPALGQHLFLDMSHAQINALDEPRWKKAILRAMGDYGLFVGDTGGAFVVVESGSSYTSFGYRDPWLKLGRRSDVPSWRDEATGSTRYLFDFRDAIDWRARLRVAAPCVAQRTC
jgi:hypothetical protein